MRTHLCPCPGVLASVCLSLTGLGWAGCGHPVPLDEPLSSVMAFETSEPLPAAAEDAAPEQVAGYQPDRDAVLFTTAQPLSLAAGAAATIERIPSADTRVLIYRLGAVQPGEQVTVQHAGQGGGYCKVAFFDHNYDLVHLGATWAPSATRAARPTACTLLDACDSLYLAVEVNSDTASSPVRLQIVRGAGAACGNPAALPRVVLNFSGAAAAAVGSGSVSIPACVAATIHPAFAGQDAILQELILQKVQADFAPFDITVTRGSEADRGPGVLMIHFGEVSSPDYGLAGHEAAVNTGAFRNLMRLGPNFDELAQALANVASHEAGHLMGLNHTADPVDLMTTVDEDPLLLTDQSFRRAVLDTAVFPIGHQAPANLIRQRWNCNSE